MYSGKSLRNFLSILAFLPAFSMANAGPVSAAPVTFFNTIPSGRSFFDQQVTIGNGTLFTDPLSGLTSGATSWSRSGYTITPTNGIGRIVSTSALNPAPTGLPGGDAIRMTADGTAASGLTFNFGTPINGFGIELDDWATCCYPSSLYISFDGGTPILIGTANVNTDNPGTAAGQGAKTFIGTIDDSATFSTITFYGVANGGDVLNAGGIIRYASVPLGALSVNDFYPDLVAGTNAEGYADYFDRFDDAGDVRTTIASYLNTATPQQITDALNTIFPVNTSVTSQTMLSSNGQTANTLMDKVGTVLGNITPAAEISFAPSMGFAQMEDPTLSASGPVAQLSAIPYTEFKTGQHALWIEGVGAAADGKATAATLGYDTISTGFVGGWEISPSDDYMLGVLGSVFASKIMLNDDAGDTDSMNYNIGLYGQKLFGSFKLTGIASVGQGEYDTKRHIDIAGVTAKPQGDYKARSAGVTLGASRLYEHKGFKFEPFTTIGYTAVKTEGYAETGGGFFNMTVSGDRFSTAAAKAGITIQRAVKLFERALTFKFKPYIAQQWEIESAGNKTGFVGTGSATTVNGRDLTLTEGGMSAEIKYDLSDKTSIKFGADISKDKFEDRLLAYLGFGYKF